MRPALAGLVVMIAAGCGRRDTSALVPGGDPGRGRKALAGFGCGSCHEIAGVPGAAGRVGPPLDGVGSRSILAGEVPNTPENMARWIRDPQAIEPETAMPSLGVGPIVAWDMVAYLYSLR